MNYFECCHNCTERSITCHSVCDRYKTAVERKEADKQAKKNAESCRMYRLEKNKESKDRKALNKKISRSRQFRV